MDRSNTLGTVERTFEILDLLWEMNGANPTELADHMDLPHSTVYDYLRTLNATKYVTRQDGEYRLSYDFLTIGGRMKYRNRLFQIAKPEMKALAAETEEYVGLNIEKDGRSLILHQEEGEQAFKIGTYPGMVVPIHTHAGGKVILASFTEDRVDEIIETHGLAQRTEKTITDPETLKRELKEISDDGYAVDWDEQVPGMGMAAVPILIDGKNLGALTVLSTTREFKNKPYREKMIHELQSTVNTITINHKYG